MSYRLMFTINAVILAIFGVLFMIMPEFALSQFGSEVYVATLFVARFFGSTLLLSGLFLWVLKDAVPVKMQKNITFLLLAYSIGGFVMSVLGMTSIGVFRTNGWVLLVIFGLFTLVYGYMLFLQPKPASTKSSSPRKVKDVPPANSGQSA
ncbi:MAG: hypothetical protein Q7T89_19525 [Anaerolineales bacterium]|nr:hypothetical protein [Anaerolineales bacterium]